MNKTIKKPSENENHTLNERIKAPLDPFSFIKTVLFDGYCKCISLSYCLLYLIIIFSKN